MPQPAPFDPYAILGLSRDATPQQVARAHRRLAKRFHPDLHPTEAVAERMRHVNEAWSILSSARTRSEFDLSHPSAGTGLGGSRANGHWAASRPPIRPAQPTTTRTWATWRATAAETQAAPRTSPQGAPSSPPTRRPQPIEPMERTFLDSGWAALLVGIVFLLVLALAVVLGKLA